MSAMLDPDACYQAMLARDGRFDGLFFVGVETTGVYCRPICPARTPGRARCRFFQRPVEAEQAGFRACFRCRPEVAPGDASVDAVSRLARAALTRIDAGYLNEHSADELAAELGVSARHLRRAVSAELGVSIVELAQTRRLALAKQLLHDTDLPITEVSFLAGFASLRRFNAAFLERFGRSPTSMRRANTETRSEHTSLRLDYVAPYDWDGIAGFLGARALAGVEALEITNSGSPKYKRTLITSEGPGWLSVRPDGVRSLRVDVHAPRTRELPALLMKLRRVFDLDARPQRISEHLAKDPRFAPMVALRPGLRLPGAFDVFELAVRAVLGQQVTVRAATTVGGRLVAAFGRRVKLDTENLTHLSPDAAVIARASESALAQLGMPGARARTLQGLAKAFCSDPTLAHGSTAEELIPKLQQIDGIGPWTAQYVAMRALGFPDAFPSSDLAVMKALGVTKSKDAERLVEPLRPWRAYAVMHLWASLS